MSNSNLNLDSILEELSNMKFSDNDSSGAPPPRVPRKSSSDRQRTQSRLTTNFDNLLDELQETKDLLEKDSFSKDLSSPRMGRRKYSNASNNSHKAYSRSRSRSRHDVDRWRDNNSPNSNSVPTSPVEGKKFPSRISSMNPSNKLKLHLSTVGQQVINRPRENSKASSRAPSLKAPEKPKNYEFDDGDVGNLPSSYRDDYEYMMNSYSNNNSPKSKPYKSSSKSSSRYNSPIASPDMYSRSYNSNNEMVSPRSDKKSKRKSSKKRYSDSESDEEEINYKSSHKSSRKSRYDDDDDEDIFMYENDVDDRHSRKGSPTHSRSKKTFNEDDFDEDESDISLSESSESFTSSSSSSEDSSENSESETDDDDVPLRSAKAKATGIRGRNRHYKKFNKLESSSYKEEKSPVKTPKSARNPSISKKEKKKKTLSTPIQRHSTGQSLAIIKSPKENYYEETAKENFLARSKKDFTTDYAEASLKKITTRIYIGDATTYESVLLTSAMSAKEVIKDLIRKRNIIDTPDWTLFELCNDFGVERPLKEWEIVTDVITSWDIQKTKNALIMKTYNYYESLLASSAVGRFPSIRGKIYMETKPGKYNKRQFELRPTGLYYYKKKNNQETLLVNLSSYDVYTLLVKMPNAPTDFAFAIKSTDPIHFFEDKKKYIYYLYTTDVNSLFDWVMSIRQGKTEKYVQEQHERENNSPGITNSRSPNVALAPKTSIHRQQQTHDDRQRIKALEIQKSKKLQKEANGPLVQIDQSASARHKSISRKSTGSSGLKPSLSGRRKEKSGPLINLDGVQASGSRKGIQSASQTPLSSSSRRGPKPLVDISDAKNCHYCGCSENKYDPWKQNVCANCHHDHRAYQ